METGFAREFVHFLDKRVDVVVARMRVGGESKLNRAGGTVQQLVQAIFVGEKESPALVGSETSGKPDGENLGIENAIGRANGFGRFADALALSLDASAHELDQAQLQFLVRVPENGIGNIHDPAPEIFVGKVFFPIAEILLVKHEKFRGQPGLGMNPVSYVSDGNFVRGDAGPDVFPEAATDFAVQFADAVGMPAQAQGQDRHAKWVGGVDPGLAEREKFVEGQADFGGETAEIFAHHFARERIVSGWHRSVGGENIGRNGNLEGRIKIEPLLPDETTNPLETEKSGVSFVHVKNFRLDPERVQRIDAADAEHDFLSHSHFEIAAVKLGRNKAVFRVVFRNVGVEQVKLDAPDVKFPKAGVNIAVQNPHCNQQRAIITLNFANRQMMKILIKTDGVLDSVLVDFLPEISVP